MSMSTSDRRRSNATNSNTFMHRQESRVKVFVNVCFLLYFFAVCVCRYLNELEEYLRRKHTLIRHRSNQFFWRGVKWREVDLSKSASCICVPVTYTRITPRLYHPNSTLKGHNITLRPLFYYVPSYVQKHAFTNRVLGFWNIRYSKKTVIVYYTITVANINNKTRCLPQLREV